MKNINKLSYALLALVACGSQVVQFPEDKGNGGCQSNMSDSVASSSSLSSSSSLGGMGGQGGLGGFGGIGGSGGLGGSGGIGGSGGQLMDAGPDGNSNCQNPTVGVVNLGRAGTFVILAKSGVSTVPTSAITGNVGVSPIAATGLTGFALILDPSNTFSTSTQVVGKVFAADYAAPTPAQLTTAVSDMETAFTDAAGRPPMVTELGAGNIGGLILGPGVYKWSTAVLIPENVTLMGACSDVWIFEIAQDLTMSSNANVFLLGGAVSKNVFWQVSGAVNLGTGAHLEGIVLTQTQVALKTGASVNGRLLAQTAVTLDQNAVTQPAP